MSGLGRSIRLIISSSRLTHRVPRQDAKLGGKQDTGGGEGQFGNPNQRPGPSMEGGTGELMPQQARSLPTLGSRVAGEVEQSREVLGHSRSFISYRESCRDS